MTRWLKILGVDMRIHNLSVGLGLILLIVYPCKHASAGVVHRINKYALDIGTVSPPALIFVTDSNKNMTGADPSKGLDNLGRGTVIEQIPSAWVEQQNTESDDVNGVFVPNSVTSWGIDIPDGGPNSYTVNLTGVSNGVSEIQIFGLFFGKPKIPKISIDQDIVIANGQTKQIQVAFDPISRSLTSTPIVNNGDFLKDTQAACGLGSISPSEACEALEDLASAVEKAKSDGRSKTEAAKLKIYFDILNRLHNWGKDGYRKDWDDFKDQPECRALCNKDPDGIKFFAKDPVYSALKLDAETLLSGLPKDSD
jgi:hypothetical protein